MKLSEDQAKDALLNYTCCCKYGTSPVNCSDEECYFGKAVKTLCYGSQGEWIPVSERLPNRNGVYNVTRIIDGTRITDACYFDGQNTWHRDTGVNHGRPYLDDIIAWQPLPEPYKKGGAE